MTEDTRIRDVHRTQSPAPEGPARHESNVSVEKAIAQRGDRYTQHLLNRVTQSLNALLRQRAVRVGDAVTRAEHGTPESGHEEVALSLFEQVFLAHFEGEAKLGEQLPSGTLKFLPKPSKEWMAFFQKFLPFTLQKTGNVSDLQAVIFRGLLQEVAEPALLISDLQFLNGKTDKFARLEIQSAEILKRLSTMMPGDALAVAFVTELLQTPEFKYFSLSHRVVNPEMVQKDGNDMKGSDIAQAYKSPEVMKQVALREGVRWERPGIALSARTEQMVAQQLNLKLGSQSGRRKKGRDLPDSPSEEGGVFVPWFELGRRKFSGKPHWFVPFTYFVIASGVGLLVYSLLKFL